MYLARNLTDFSTTEIGNEFGGKDHSTVIHAVSKISERCGSDEGFKMKIEKIIKGIREEG